jgi:hypothetical protein
MAVDAGLADSAAVAVRPLAADHATRQIVVAWRAGSSRAAEGRLLAEVFKGGSHAPPKSNVIPDVAAQRRRSGTAKGAGG